MSYSKWFLTRNMGNRPVVEEDPSLQRILIAAGLIILAIGLLWPWLARLPLGRLPGDILIDKPGVKIYFPLTTLILISVLLSLIIWLLRK